MEKFQNKKSSNLDELMDLKITLNRLSQDVSNDSLPEEKKEQLFGEYMQKYDRRAELEIENAIVDMERPLQKIIDQIYPSIENGEYTTIIGDDASGRAPALVLNTIIKDSYKKNGKNSPQILFIGGAGNTDAEKFDPYNIDREMKKDAISEHLNSHLESKNGKVLIVTDYIETGASLSSLINALDSMNIQHTIATLSIGDKFTKTELEERLGEIYSGGGVGIPGIYRKYALSGVAKTARNVLSHPAIHEGMIKSSGEVARNRRKLSELTNELQLYLYRKNNQES